MSYANIKVEVNKYCNRCNIISIDFYIFKYKCKL